MTGSGKTGPSDRPAGGKPRPAAIETLLTSVGFAVHVNGRPLRTPLGAEVVVPTPALAEALTAEMRVSGGVTAAKLRADSMPLTRMASTALDRVARHRADIEGQLLAYAETELLCHRAEHPPDLVARQRTVWQPLLDWLAHRHDALLAVTTGVVAKPQSPASVDALRAVIGGFDVWRLTGVSVAVAASGSLVIGLAMAAGHLDAAQAFDAAELDESYQIEKWGEDKEATERRASIRAELELAARFFGLLNRSEPP